ncbi:MAG TPA: mechanosensitive ion channel family protein [Steroidobacteraceae bacterium]|jgi:small-conductance mechanosensitive channel|nr:mechanosensitive ion channel family protein [Steroidobacteraceae bacterium]
MNFVDEMLELPIFRNSLADWSLALGLMAVLLAVLLWLRGLVRRYHQKLLATEKTELAEVPMEVLSRTTLLFFVVVAVFTGLTTLEVGPHTERVLRSVLTVTVFWQAGVWISAAANGWLERRRRQSAGIDRAVVGSLSVIGFVVRVVIWALVALLALDNLGIDVTALVAGLGIGGIAVALAVQNILGDLFASLSITFDKPFVLGDFLIVDDFLGSVEYIGIKSTRLRSLSGEQIVLSNADLLKSRIRNYGRMAERRVVFTIWLPHETPLEHIERVPVLIREIIQAQQATRFDRSHFARHGQHSLEFETVYYVLSPDYNRYMDIQQAINLRLHRELAQLGIKFAYPAHRVFIEPMERASQLAVG